MKTTDLRVVNKQSVDIATPPWKYPLPKIVRLFDMLQWMASGWN